MITMTAVTAVSVMPAVPVLTFVSAMDAMTVVIGLMAGRVRSWSVRMVAARTHGRISTPVCRREGSPFPHGGGAGIHTPTYACSTNPR